MCGSFFRMKFSRFALLLKRLQWDSKTDLTTKGLILEFFDRMFPVLLSSNLNGLKSARISQLCFYSECIESFWWLVWGVFWSGHQMCLYLLSIGFSNIDCWALSFHFNFTSFELAFTYIGFSQLMTVFWWSFISGIGNWSLNLGEKNCDVSFFCAIRKKRSKFFRQTSFRFSDTFCRCLFRKVFPWFCRCDT